MRVSSSVPIECGVDWNEHDDMGALLAVSTVVFGKLYCQKVIYSCASSPLLSLSTPKQLYR